MSATSSLEETVQLSTSELVAMEEIDLDTHVAYLSGSLVEGLGHRSSDVDIYVVGDHQLRAPFQFARGSHAVGVHFVGERRVDVEVWRPAYVNQLATMCGTLSPDKSAEPLSLSDESFIHRLSVGVPLSSREGFEELKRRFDFARYRGYMLRRAIEKMDNAHDDLVGMTDSNQIEVASLRARDLVNNAVDALNIHHGFTSNREKWRAAYLRRRQDDPFTKEAIDFFWSFQSRDVAALCTDRHAFLEMVHEAVMFSNRVVAHVNA